MNRSLAALLALWLALAHAPGRAAALDALVPPVSGGELLGFGAAYGAVRRVTHRGIDLAGRPGETVVAPCGGIVMFAGRVPGDSGARVGAVTIQPEPGVLVTVLPLQNVTVATGDVVGRSDCVGTMAPQGDDSSPTPHVHLSVRRDGSYVDPGVFLQDSSQPGSVAEDANGSLQEPEASPPTLSEEAVGSGEPARVGGPEASEAIPEKQAPGYSDVPAGAGRLSESPSSAAQHIGLNGAVGCADHCESAHAARFAASRTQCSKSPQAAATPEEEEIVRCAYFQSIAAWGEIRTAVAGCRQVSEAASTHVSSPRPVQWSIPGMCTATIAAGAVAMWLQRRPKPVRA